MDFEIKILIDMVRCRQQCCHGTFTSSKSIYIQVFRANACNTTESVQDCRMHNIAVSLMKCPFV